MALEALKRGLSCWLRRIRSGAEESKDSFASSMFMYGVLLVNRGCYHVVLAGENNRSCSKQPTCLLKVVPACIGTLNCYATILR